MLSFILNRSVKGAVTSFVEHPVDSLLSQLKVRKNEVVEQMALNTNKIHEEDSPAVLNQSTKEAMTDFFRREYFP